MSSEMPTFSYAQAAKGASGSQTPLQAATTEPEKIDLKSEELPQQPTENVSAAPVAETQQTPKVDSDVQDAGFTTVTKHVRSKVVHPRASSSSVRSSAAQSKDGDSSNTPNGKEDALDKAHSDVKTKSENGSVSSKGKAEKEKAAPKELKAAPLPSVNIWQQRQQAQDAKGKTAPAKSVSGKNTEDVQQDIHKGGKKKNIDSASENTKDRKKSESVKARDDSLPVVEDTSLWPTPEVAIGEEKKKAQEKPVKAESTDKSPTRSHGKEKWMPVNYVPSAVFSTPLPSSGGRGARRGGRGGRDGGRGGSHAAADKNASGNHAAKHGSGERGPTESGNNRAASQSGRSASADRNVSEGRKAGRGPRGTDEAANGKQTNGENVAHAQRDGKQFSKNESRNSKPNVAVDPARANNYSRTQSNSKSADPTRESSGFQDFNRERGDIRAERGGRGGNRGRGGSYFHQNGQQGNMPNGFVPKSFNYSERQRSHGSIPNGSHQGNRMSIRSPSLPASGTVYPGYGYNNDLMYGVSPVTNGPVAYPQQYVEPYSLMNMLSMQLDYYFSVDNLCKDMFLRRQMDSQGFVPLGVIANFKRVKSLTDDIELIRHVILNLRNAEYQIGQDGIERLRPREKWETWVLSLDQRDDIGKTDGAAPAQAYENAIPNGSSLHAGSQQFIPNGVSHNPRAHLSTAAPEFLPSYAQNEISDVRSKSHDSWESFDSRESPPNIRQTHKFKKSDNSPAHRLNSKKSQHFTLRTNSSNSFNYRKTNMRNNQDHSATFNSRQNQDLERRAPGEGYCYTQHKRINKKMAEDFASERLWNDRGSAHRYALLADALATKFDTHLYDDLRRFALDNLLTQHAPDSFQTLMSFYAAVFETDQDIPIQVFSDLAHLAFSDLSIEYSSAAFAVMQNTMAHGRIFHTNVRKAELCFGLDFSLRMAKARNGSIDEPVL